MINQDVIDTEASLNRVKRISGGIRVFLLVLAGLLAILLAVKVWVAFLELPDGNIAQDGMSILLMAVTDAIIIACVLIGSDVFATLKKGVDPFSRRQSRIIRVAACLLLVDLVLSAFGASAFPWFAQYSEMTVGMTPSYGESTLINVNAGDLIVAGILFGLSVVFDYVRYLQELSDETL